MVKLETRELYLYCTEDCLFKLSEGKTNPVFFVINDQVIYIEEKNGIHWFLTKHGLLFDYNAYMPHTIQNLMKP